MRRISLIVSSTNRTGEALEMTTGANRKSEKINYAAPLDDFYANSR